MPNPIEYRPRGVGRLVVAAAMAAGLTPLGSAAHAQDLPTFRKGMWELNRTIEGAAASARTITAKKCMSPTDEMRKQNDMLAKAGCRISAVTRSGSSYSFTSQCSLQGVATQSKSVITADGDSAYRIDVESQQGAEKTRERLAARRIGDC